MMNKCQFRQSGGTRLRTTFTVWTVAAYFTTKCSFNFGNLRRYKTVRTASKRQVKSSASDEVKDVNKLLKLMGLIKERRGRRGLVEDCEVITASTPGIFKCRGVLMSASILRPGVYRHWLQCPLCGRQSFKLYRPCGATVPTAITWSTKARSKKPTQGGHCREDVPNRVRYVR